MEHGQLQLVPLFLLNVVFVMPVFIHLRVLHLARTAMLVRGPSVLAPLLHHNVTRVIPEHGLLHLEPAAPPNALHVMQAYIRLQVLHLARIAMLARGPPPLWRL